MFYVSELLTTCCLPAWSYRLLLNVDLWTELLKNLLVELMLELINLKARRGTAVVIAVTRVVHWGIECGRAAPTSAS